MEEFITGEPVVGFAALPAGAQQLSQQLLLTNRYTFPFLSSHPLDRDTSVKKLIIVVHGSGRNAEGYFRSAVSAAPQGTVVFAYWSQSGWKKGDLSEIPSTSRYSSYEMVDRLIDLGVRHYPRLEKIMVIGHSAGGQFVHRYAGGSQREASLKNIDFTYVVANPSSYLYLNPLRWNKKVQAFMPGNKGECRDFNLYHKGLEELNQYMRSTGGKNIKSNLVKRNVVYLLGSEDDDPQAEQLDQSCAAMQQGENRLERGNLFVQYLDTYFSKHTSRKVIAQGVGHSSFGIFNSPEGKAVLAE
ncbi:hypothetical protein HYX13_03640 [Candidatus Woesearchaeota archaeon]|nr:hypothetical protein [Candidatus Woesearchaeota archaeon]